MEYPTTRKIDRPGRPPADLLRTLPGLDSRRQDGLVGQQRRGRVSRNKGSRNGMSRMGRHHQLPPHHQQCHHQNKQEGRKRRKRRKTINNVRQLGATTGGQHVLRYRYHQQGVYLEIFSATTDTIDPALTHPAAPPSPLPLPDCLVVDPSFEA
jgi:hypothetical protein